MFGSKMHLKSKDDVYEQYIFLFNTSYLFFFTGNYNFEENLWH